MAAPVELIARGFAEDRVTGLTSVATREDVDAGMLLDAPGLVIRAKVRRAPVVGAPRMIEGLERLWFPAAHSTTAARSWSWTSKRAPSRAWMHVVVGSTGAW